jgi:hypothetical protein
MRDVLYWIRVQVELQQAGGRWQVKGCTAYASDGMQKPLPLMPQYFGSRRAAIRAMKQNARKHLCVDDSETSIRWQFVLWFTPFPVITHRPCRGDTGHLTTEPYDTAALARTV